MALAQLGNPAAQAVPPAVGARRRFRVQTKLDWLNDDWETAHYLEPLKATVAAISGQTSATFRYHYGHAIKREDEVDFSTYAPPLLLDRDYYVAIHDMEIVGEENPAPVWVGVIPRQQLQVQAARSEKPQGDVDITAFGLDWIFSRRFLDGSIINTGAANADWVRTDANFAFNSRSRHRAKAVDGNRSTERKVSGNRTSYVFGSDGRVPAASDDERWTASDLLEYLLNWDGRLEEGEFIANRPDFEFQPGSPGGLNLGLFSRVFAQQNRDLRTQINNVVDASRGSGATIRLNRPAVQDGSLPIQVHVFSEFPEDIETDDGTIRRNEDRVSIRIGPDATDGVSSTKVSYDHAASFERVKVRGARLRSMFSLSMTDGTLITAWIDELETEYANAVPGIDAEEKDRFRKLARFQEVYRNFAVPAGFNWLVGNGLGEVDEEESPVRRIAIPKFDDNAKIVAADVEEEGDTPGVVAGEYWNRETSFDRKLLLPSPGDENEFKMPFAVIRIDEFVGGEDTFDHWSLLKESDEVRGSLLMLDYRPGVSVRAGDINHSMAKGVFDPAVYETAIDPAADYRSMVVTVAMQMAIQPAVIRATNIMQTNRRTTLLVEMPDAETWWVVNGTVLDVASSQVALSHFSDTSDFLDGKLVRDDTPRLRVVAAMAAGFYGVDRAAVVLEFDDILTLDYPVGTMITEIKEAGHWLPVNTVVTEKQFDFQSYKTRVITDHQRIDFGRII